MIGLILFVLALSFVARHGFAWGLVCLAAFPFLVILAIPGLLILAGTIVALGG